MTNEQKCRIGYSGAIGLLCEISIYVDEEQRELIERAVNDWCELTKWKKKRILNRIEVEPPREREL